LTLFSVDTDSLFALLFHFFAGVGSVPEDVPMDQLMQAVDSQIGKLQQEMKIDDKAMAVLLQQMGISSGAGSSR
jgi:hypothetical protein